MPRNTEIPFPREHRTSQLFPSSSRRSAYEVSLGLNAKALWALGQLVLKSGFAQRRIPSVFAGPVSPCRQPRPMPEGACHFRPDPSTKNEFPARLSPKRSRRARFAARASDATSFPPGTRVARWHQTLHALERRLLICCTDGSRVNSEDEPVSRRGVLSELSASRGTDLPKARDDAHTGLIPRGSHSVS